ncbi:MAG TPA: hypothetical protein VIL72_01465 [Beijerinckiaceae bacterium]
MPQRLSARLLLSASLLVLAGAAAAEDGFLIEAPRPVAAAPKPARPAPAEAPAAPAREEPRAQAAKRAPTIQGLADGPDETALRYYAAQGQTARVAAETARLQRLHPEWRPPDNLYEPQDAGAEDEQTLWDLFGADRLDELKTLIAQRQRHEPGWKPSPEFTEKFNRKLMRQRLLTLWKEGRLRDIVDVVRADGYGGAESDVDLRWTLAEVHARMKQTSEAIGIYQSILASSREQAERVATIQKAMDVLRISDVEPLIAQGRPGEFAALATDITRARISAYLHDERVEPIPAQEFKAFEAYARGVSDANQAGLVAWHHYKARDHRAALDWFKLALERGGDAMVAHGLAHTLRELGMSREAEEVAYAWREPLINNAILYVDLMERELTRAIPRPIEPERLARYAQVTMDLASGEGAQALGWYAFNTCQYEAAHAWFMRAVAWYPKEATVVGLALAARRLKRSKELFELANPYDGLFPKLIELLFPDTTPKPPGACEVLANRQTARGGVAAVTAPTWTPPGAPDASSARHRGWSAGPSPILLTRPPVAPAAAASWRQPAWTQPQVVDPLPKFGKDEFPTAVDPDNPLRFASTGKLFGPPAASAAQGAALTPFAGDPWRQRPPLVARRTPGVGPMPYERWGFSLLPSPSGAQTADTPHSAQTAPAGTMWASERPAAAAAAADALDDDPYRAIAGAARVPLPTAVRLHAPGHLRSSSLAEDRRLFASLGAGAEAPDRRP